MSTHVPPRRDEGQKQGTDGQPPVPETQPTAPAPPAVPLRAAVAPAAAVSLTAGTLPGWAPWGAILGSAAAAAAILAVIGFKIALFLIFTAIISGVVIYTWSRAVEGSRAATDRGVTVIVTVAFMVAVVAADLAALHGRRPRPRRGSTRLLHDLDARRRRRRRGRLPRDPRHADHHGAARP